MENEKGLKALLILTAIALLGVGSTVVYLINPKPVEQPLQEKAEIRMEMSKDLLPPPPEPEEEKKPLTDDVAARMVIADHINSFLLRSYSFGGMSRDEYVAAIAEAAVLHTDSIEKALWIVSMMQTESSFRLSAKPGKSTNSSARGFLQVIWRYHGTMLSKHGISKEDLATDISKSVKAGVLVFEVYLKREKGDFKKALRRYRSLSASEAEHRAYFNSINSVFQKLKGDLKEVKAS